MTQCSSIVISFNRTIVSTYGAILLLSDLLNCTDETYLLITDIMKCLRTSLIRTIVQRIQQLILLLLFHSSISYCVTVIIVQ